MRTDWYKTSGLHPGFWIRGGAHWANEKCRRGDFIRIIAVQMNLPDPRGVETVPRGGEIPPLMQPCKLKTISVPYLC